MKAFTQQQLKAIAVAFIFLTRVPMPALKDISSADYSRSLPWFLVVGLTLGLLLSSTAYCFQDNSALLIAALLISVNAMFTGGLHFDGVADSADAWLAGGDKERTLEIMKDPRCGSGAVLTLIALCLLQFAAIYELIQAKQWMALLLAPLLGRAALLSIFMSTPYVRPQGLATEFLHHANRPLILGLIGLCALLCSYLGYIPAISLLVTALFLFLLRRLMLKRIDGCTGDTAGACVELCSTMFMMVWALNL